MKATRYILARLLFVTGFFLISSIGYSQEIRLTRQEKKEIRKAQMTANFYVLDTLLNLKSFVLEADFLRDRNGLRVPVLSTINFIKVDNVKGVLQTGSEAGLGFNGIGGVTAEGIIGAWNVEKNFKDLSYTVRFNLTTQIGHYNVSMIVYSDTRASATITGLRPGNLTWEGHLQVPGNSRIFKGENTI